jgi:hypothetical protein
MPKPVLQALVLADHVYQDKSTGKMVIAGTFRQFNIVKLRPPSGDSEKPAQDSGPQDAGQSSGELHKLSAQQICRVGSPWVYVSLTELRGAVPLELRYVDLRDNTVLLRAELSVNSSNNPLDTTELAVQFPPLPIPHLGTYALELLFENELLGSHRVTVSEMPAPEKNPDEQT